MQTACYPTLTPKDSVTSLVSASESVSLILVYTDTKCVLTKEVIHLPDGLSAVMNFCPFLEITACQKLNQEVCQYIQEVVKMPQKKASQSNWVISAAFTL